MSYLSGEGNNRGCVALINLVISAIILLGLLIFLLPDFINFPDWFSNYVDVTKVEKRKVWGATQSFPPQSANPRFIIFINTRLERKKITKVIREKDTEKYYEILLSCKRSDLSDLKWEKKIGRIYPNNLPDVHLLYDSSFVYAVFQNDIWAYALETGQEQWHFQLNEALADGCKNCIQLDLEQKMMLIQSRSNQLKGISLVSGVPVWEKNFPGIIFSDFFTSIPTEGQAGFILTSLNSGNPESLWVYLNTLSGEEIQKISLPKEIEYASVRNQSLLLLYTLKRQDFVEKIQIPDGKIDWNKPLVRNSALESSYYENEELYPDDLFYYMIGQDQTGKSQRIIRLDYQRGKTDLLYETQAYDLKIVHDDPRRLYIQAWNKSNNAQMELWAVEKDSGKIFWKFALDPALNFISTKRNLNLALYTERKKLYCIQGLNLPRRIRASVLDVTKGKLLQEQEFSVEDVSWTGTHWLAGKAYLTIGDLYLLDLEKLTLRSEWP